MEKNSEAMKLFEQGYNQIISGLQKLGYAPDGDENFRGTAARAAKGLAELVLDRSYVDEEIAALMRKTFPAQYKEMVISKHNVAFGMCPHHLLPVLYRISLAYIPTEKVLGISKLSRIASMIARAPALQEELTHSLATLLYKDLDSHGSAVYVEGLHMCMAARGIGAHEARVVTSAVRGVFLENLATRQEFIRLVTASHPTLL